MRRTLDNKMMVEFLKLVHSGGDGYIPVGVHMPTGEWREIFFKGEDEAAKGLLKTYATYCDIYITPNSFYRTERKTRSIRKLNAIKIDIDCHDISHASVAPVQELIYSLYLELFNNGLMPEPNLINTTGRGIHIYWLLDPVPSQVTNFYKKISHDMCKVIDNWLRFKDYGYNVDYGTSTDPAHYMRLPGSKNQKTGTYCKSNPTHNKKRYTLYELNDIYSYGQSDKPRSNYKKTNKPVGNYKKRYDYILDDLETLRDMRFNAPQHMWCRERMTFLYRNFARLAGYDSEAALKMTHKYNQGFRLPLIVDKLDKHSESADKAYKEFAGYKYSTASIIDLLGINIEEIPHMKTLVDEVTRKRRYNEKQRKAYGNRNAEGYTETQQRLIKERKWIAELDAQGLTQSQIVAITDFSLSKVKWLRAELRAKTREAQVADNTKDTATIDIKQFSRLMTSGQKLYAQYTSVLTSPSEQLGFSCDSPYTGQADSILLEDTS